jgi:deaminated glutathione amidase
VHNTSVAVDPEGRIAAVYRKIHLFDVDLTAQGGLAYRESDRVAPGAELVHVETPFGGIGLSVCYDVRFPELYRALAARGVRFLAVPAAFARETGQGPLGGPAARPGDREPGLRDRRRPGGRARRRPGQLRALDDRRSLGPRAGPRARRPGPIVAECRLEEQDRIRAALPALRHRRL